MALSFRNHGLDLSDPVRQIAHAAYQDGAPQRLHLIPFIKKGAVWV